MTPILRPRRRAWLLLAAAALTAGAAQAQPAAAYPSKPIRLIVAVAAGSGTDLLARTIAEPLAQILGQPVVVENKPGAYSIVGAELVAKAPADGYTLLFGGTGPMVANQAINPGLPYNVLRDFAPVSIVGLVPVAITARNGMATDLKDAIRIAKAKPGAVSYSSSSTSFQIAAEMWARMVGVKLLHVPYRGSAQAVQAVATGEVDMSFSDVPPVIALAQAERVRVLAVTTEPRPPSLQKVPLVADAGVPGYEFTFFHGLAAPAATPQPVIDKLYQAVAKVMQMPVIRTRIAETGVQPVSLTPAQATERIRRDIQHYTELAKAENIKAE